jgi:hypothetical protein
MDTNHEDFRYVMTSSAEHDLVCNQYNERKGIAEKLVCNYNERKGIVENPTRPNHYGGAGNVYEVFNVLEAWDLDKDFYLGNVIKYVARAGKKNKSKEKEDLEKALVYLQKRIDSL